MAVFNCINDSSSGLYILDDTDITKVLTFDTSGITTATTRTWTADDRDIDFDAVATTYTTDSGDGTASSGTLSIVGSGTVSTSATGSTVTITGTGGGTGGVTSWVILTGGESQPYSLSVNTGYICTSASNFTAVLPTTSSVGDIIRISEFSSLRSVQINQNASQYIIGVSGTTTTGTGGYLLTNSTDRTSIELVCHVANTGWVIISDNSGTYALN